MSPQNTILSRIKKLLNLTEARGATPDEAANAAAKVQALLFEHNLSMSAVNAHTLETPGETIGEFQQKVKGAKNSMRWRMTLYSDIARNNFCDVIYVGKEYVAIFGKPSNVEVVQYMAEYIGNTIHQMARKGMLDEQKRTGLKVSWPYYTAFAQGAVTTIAYRLRESLRQHEAATAQCMALVVQSKGEVKVFIQQAYPRLGKARPLRASRADAFRHGQREGHTIPLNKGLTQQAQKARLS